MGKTAMDKLEEAKDLRKLGNDLVTSDPAGSRALKALAKRKVRQAVKQMTPGRKRRSTAGTFLGR